MERIYLSKITTLLILFVGVIGFLVGAYARPLAERSLASRFGDSSPGRFNLVLSPLVKADKFLLDTQTGKIWQIVKSGEPTDKSATGYRVAKFEDKDAHLSDDRSKVLKVAGDRMAKDKFLKARVDKNNSLAQKSLNEKTANDEVTIEVITNGKISEEKVPHERSMEPYKKEKADGKNTLSVKPAGPSSL